MKQPGPDLEPLTRRLAESPPEFLQAPQIGGEAGIHPDALVADLLRAVSGKPFARVDPKPFLARGAKERNRLQLIQIACWLLFDPWFRQPALAPPLPRLLTEGLDGLARVVAAERFVNDEERREELVRYLLAQLGLRPRGETAAQAQDRLLSLDSLERERVIREAEAAKARQRKIQEELRRKAAAEAAAAKASRE